MNIGGLAARTGVSVRMIRHCKEIELIASAARTEAGYRSYAEADVTTLRFIGRTHGLGSSLDEIANLLALWRDRASSDVETVVARHSAEIECKIRELRSLQESLAQFAARCRGRPAGLPQHRRPGRPRP